MGRKLHDAQIAFEHGLSNNRPSRIYRVTVKHDFGDNDPRNDFLFTDYYTNKDMAEEAGKLYDAIRKHRDQRGDDRCWMDDEELYKALPEGYTPPERDTAIELTNCERFIACRRNPATTYVSPEREIERLRDDAARWRWCENNIRSAKCIFDMIDYEGGDVAEEIDEQMRENSNA